MNPLRNPFVVGALTIAAGVLVLLNVNRSGSHSPWAAKAPRLVPGSSAVEQKFPAGLVGGPVTPEPERALLPMELDSIQTNLTRWIQSPRRDPFRSRFEPQTQAVRLLVLKAVWRQTDGDVAVINDKLVSTGDRILDFTVERIEPDRVWVTGANGREELRFKPAAARSKTSLPSSGVAITTDGRH